MSSTPPVDVVESELDPAGGFSGFSRRTWQVVGLVAALLVLVAGAAVVLRATGGDAAEQVLARDEAQRRAVVAGDAASLERILAPGAEVIPPPGDALTRDEYVGAIASGDLDFKTFEPISPVEVEINGSAAVVTYQCRFEVTAGVSEYEHDAWVTHVYDRQDSEWRMVWSQATAVGGFPPPTR